MTKVLSVRKAREMVLSEGAVPDEARFDIRPEVVNSWRRSILSGAQISLPVLPFVGELDTQSELCWAAQPVLGPLADRLSGLGASVLLADRHARILRRWVSDLSILPLLDTLRSDSGFTASEEIVGTNGVGTVAEIGRPIQIVGHEHLMESMVPFTCVGVPVHHPISHRLEGVITMSCRADASSALLTPLMESAAADVEHRLLQQASQRERIVLEAYLAASRGGVRRVAGVGQDIFIAGPRVTQLLEGTHQVVLWETVRAALGGRAQAKADLTLADGRFLPISCRPIESGGQLVGALVDFGGPMSTSAESPPTGSARSRMPGRPAGLPGLAGASAAWGEAVESVRRGVASGAPLLVVGEVGVGKRSLALAAIREASPAAEVAEIDCADPAWESTSTALPEIDRVLGSDAAFVVLRHLEALSPVVAVAVASRLDAGLPSAVRLVGTFTSASGTPATPEHQRLVAVLGAVQVQIPPLRERSEDIPLVAGVVARAGARRITLSSGALRALIRAPWPGNVIQLRATLLSVASQVSGEIQATHLPAEIQACATRRQLTTLEHVELRAILDALKQANGNKVVAARIVGVSRSTLYRKLNSYRIDPDADYF